MEEPPLEDDPPLTFEAAAQLIRPYSMPPVDLVVDGRKFQLRYWLYDSRKQDPARSGVMVCFHGIGGCKTDFAALVKGPLPGHIGFVVVIDWPFFGGNCSSEWDALTLSDFLFRPPGEAPDEDDVRFLAKFANEAVKQKILPPILKTLQLNQKLANAKRAKTNAGDGQAVAGGAATHLTEFDTIAPQAAVKEVTNVDDLKIDLVGHSFGGIVALHYGILFASQLNSLTVVDSALIYPKRSNLVDWVLNNSPTESHYISEFHGVRNRDFRDFIKGGNLPGYFYWDAVLQNHTSSVGFHRYAKVMRAHMDEAKSAELYLQCRAKLADSGGKEKLFYVAAGANLTFVQSTLDFLKEHNLPFETVDNAGHFISIDKPEAFCKVLAKQL
ncbi:unnamed protein product [Amoebophrya sp. A120]|nr:unnamed protein product [Amoebophrya sp. A120]|eukprot:GSA120T00005252001.1